MKITLQANEKLVREGAANLQRGIETVGGRLFLTDQRLCFQAHAFNLQVGATQIMLSDVIATKPSWTKFLGLVPLFPNSLAVQTRPADEYRFVLSGRREWAAAIAAQAQAAEARQFVQAGAAPPPG